MSNKPYRVPTAGTGGVSGRLIDRSQTIDFHWNNRKYAGFAGDTLASALFANGIRVVGRSFKYHRPRGVLGLGSNEPNALVGVGKRAGRASPKQNHVSRLLIDYAATGARVVRLKSGDPLVYGRAAEDLQHSLHAKSFSPFAAAGFK